MQLHVGTDKLVTVYGRLQSTNEDQWRVISFEDSDNELSMSYDVVYMRSPIQRHVTVVYIHAGT